MTQGLVIGFIVGFAVGSFITRWAVEHAWRSSMRRHFERPKSEQYRREE